MSAIVITTISSLSFAVFALVLTISISRQIRDQQVDLYQQIAGTGVRRSDMCMLLCGNTESPGVAAVKDGHLLLRPVVGAEYTIPLDQVTLLHETDGIGRAPWVGKRVLHLHTDSVSPLCIGVLNPKPWRKLLAAG